MCVFFAPAVEGLSAGVLSTNCDINPDKVSGGRGRETERERERGRGRERERGRETEREI